MTRDEILEKARRDYPAGTKHYGYSGRPEKKIYTSNGIFEFSGNNLYCKSKFGCIYRPTI